MELLTNEALIHCHRDAISLELEQDFIDMLAKEIKRRNLEPALIKGKVSTWSA